MRKMSKGGKIALGILCSVLVLASLACFLAVHSLAEMLSSQYAAERWAGEGETSFAQVSCFLPADEPVDKNRIYAFRYAILDRLHEAGMEADTHTRLFRDAWSTAGQVNAASELGHGQVSVIAVGGDYFHFHPLRLLSGAYISEEDLMEDRVLLDKETAWLLFGGTDLAGMPVKLNGVPFVISGVVEREQDFASRKAYVSGRGIYMSYDAYVHLNENASATCYELVMAEPVRQYTLSFVQEKFPIGQGEIVENTGRFRFGRILGLLGQFGERSMKRSGAVYPYWENAARCMEDWCALLALMGILLLLFPGGLLLILLGTALRRGRKKLEEETLPGLKNRAAEALEKRRRERWERENQETF